MDSGESGGDNDGSYGEPESRLGNSGAVLAYGDRAVAISLVEKQRGSMGTKRAAFTDWTYYGHLLHGIGSDNSL